MTTETHDSNSCNCEMCQWVEQGKYRRPHCCDRCDESDRQEQQLIEQVHAAMAEDCDCELHRLSPKERTKRIDVAIDEVNAESSRYASIATIRAALFDTFDQNVKELAAHDCEKHRVTDEEACDNRCDFVDAVCKRVLQLQQPPHGMDALSLRPNKS
jgi:hypothetical protein